jgi:hypothetical protein
MVLATRLANLDGIARARVALLEGRADDRAVETFAARTWPRTGRSVAKNARSMTTRRSVRIEAFGINFAGLFIDRCNIPLHS